MPRRPRPELQDHRCDLAGLIHAAMESGQRADPEDPKFGIPWTEAALANATAQQRSTVEGWHSRSSPHRPPNIVPLLKAFYDGTWEFKLLRLEMYQAWRRAGGYPVIEPLEPLHRIETEKFSDHAAVIALSVDRPAAPNDSMVIPFSLRIHPDRRVRFADKTVELGIREAFFEVQSENWQPGPDSILWTKDHPNVESDATRMGVKIIGPRNDNGVIDGEPLSGVSTIALRPRQPGLDGPVTLYVAVFDDAITVTPRDVPNVSDKDRSAYISNTKRTVIEAIFGGAFRKDGRGRLIAASETVQPPNLTTAK
jgi:hypothetical protein